MSPVTDAFEKALLDWVTGAAAAVQPTGRFISFATGTPNQAGASDGTFGGGVGGFGRGTVTFAAANSPQMSATNLNVFSNITAGATATIVGFNIWNSSSGGQRIMFGTVTADIGMKTTDNLLVSAGTIKIVLS